MFEYTLQIDEGETLVLSIERQSPRLDVDGNLVYVNQVLQYDPVDMTGWIGHMQVRQGFDGKVAVDITNVENDDGLLTFENGVFTITIKFAKTFKIKTGMVYDVFGFPPGGEPDKIMGGTVRVRSSVTHA